MAKLTRFLASLTTRRFLAGLALVGTLGCGLASTAQAEEYWGRRHHPQSHVIIRTTEWNDHHGRDHHREWREHRHHHFKHFRPRVIMRPAYTPRVIYVPRHSYPIDYYVPWDRR